MENSLFRSFFTIYFKRLLFLIPFFSIIHLFGEDFCTLDHGIMSIYAVRDSGEVLIDKNSDISLTPASCMKVVTTAAALHLLGAESRLETFLEYDGFIDHAKVLHGNLYIRGSGDPCLGSNRISDGFSWKQQIEAWAEAIQKLGIQRIEGTIIGDASKWEKALAVPSWSWEDLGNYYGAGACALSFHENCYHLFFKPGNSVGENATILRTEPPLASLTIQNEVKTGPEGSGDRACIYGSEFSHLQFVRGTIPLAVKEFSIKGAIPDPASYVADLLTERLEQRGILIDRQELKQKNNKIAFYTTYSPTIREIVQWTNQKSINLYAEHLLKKMGEVVEHEGSTVAGIKAVSNFWKSQGVDLSGFYMVDGSGLSRKNLITTKQLVSMLLKIKKSDFFPIFFDSLPQRENAIRAKDGFMTLVRGYAGYVGDIVFAVLVNQCTDQQVAKEKINMVFSHLAQLIQKETHP